SSMIKSRISTLCHWTLLVDSFSCASCRMTESAVCIRSPRAARNKRSSESSEAVHDARDCSWTHFVRKRLNTSISSGKDLCRSFHGSGRKRLPSRSKGLQFMLEKFITVSPRSSSKSQMLANSRAPPSDNLKTPCFLYGMPEWSEYHWIHGCRNGA